MGIPIEDFASYIGSTLIVVLLILHLVSIRLQRKEHTERILFMDRMERAARVYSRETYEFMILKLMQRATESIHCYWHSLNIPEDSPNYQAINAELGKAASKNLDVRILTGREQGRIAAAHELKNVNARIQVRFSESLYATDLRFTLIDDAWVVFGLPVSSPEPSREGIELMGRKLSALLAAYFEEQWDAGEDYQSYGGGVVRLLLSQKTNSPTMVADRLNLPLAEVQQLGEVSP
jgi:hypothetical protein